MADESVDTFFFQAFRMGLSFWLCLMGYCFVSALLNLCIFRRLYLELLRNIYRVSYFHMKE